MNAKTNFFDEYAYDIDMYIDELKKNLNLFQLFIDQVNTDRKENDLESLISEQADKYMNYLVVHNPDCHFDDDLPCRDGIYYNSMHFYIKLIEPEFKPSPFASQVQQRIEVMEKECELLIYMINILISLRKYNIAIGEIDNDITRKCPYLNELLAQYYYESEDYSDVDDSDKY